MIKPRLPSSLKPQDFPKDYVKMIKDVVGKNFKKAIKERELIVEGFIFKEEICLRLGLKSKESIKQINFEASVEYSVKKQNIMDQIYLAIDALASMLEEFQGDEDTVFPVKWEEFKMDGKPVFLRGHTTNTELEKVADLILGDEAEEEE